MKTPAADSATSLISLWLVEDDSRYRETLTYLLDHTSDLRCDRVFYAFEEVQALVEGDVAWQAPDVVLMDIGLPGINGIEGLARLKPSLPEVPIVMLTISDDAEMIYQALRAGASGYLLKDTPLDQTMAAIREAYHGGTLMPAPVAHKVLGFFSKDLSQTDYGLTDREIEVLRLMTEGYSQKQIADVLCLSRHTVDNHIRHIYRKLHVHSGIEAVSKAIRERLI